MIVIFAAKNRRFKFEPYAAVGAGTSLFVVFKVQDMVADVDVEWLRGRPV